MRSIGVLVVAAALLVAGPTEAKKAITPKAGGYIGKVTNKNGTGEVKLVVATFRTDHGDKKGPQLFSWAGILKCKDGSKSYVNPTVFAPLRGAKFSGRAKMDAQTVTLKGRFTSNTKLKGTARATSKGCDTGPVTFKAHLR
jgi:hypothetical protein